MSKADMSVLLNPAVLAALVVLAAVEIGLFVWALLDWLKRPAEAIRGNRIVWLVVFALINTVGPVLYLTLGRLPKPAAETDSPLTGTKAEQALDSLYGREDQDAR